MRVILTGGGTGGHIYPALAIAGGILQRWPETKILYIGGSRGMESRVVPDKGYAFAGIAAEGWQGRKWQSLAQALIATHQGRNEARRIMAGFQPQAVIGTGGYVCLPVAAAALSLRVPVYLHEQNAFPGMTNRLISCWAKRVMLSFGEAARHFPRNARRRVVITGLPVRPEIMAARRQEALDFFGLSQGPVTILATGGSQGAQSINRAMLHVMKEVSGNDQVQVLMGSGRRDHEQMAEELKLAGLSLDKGNIRLLPYIDRMDLAYAAADIYVGRAGAATLAEITACSLPAVLIPYPYAAEDHQTHNARSLSDQGGALLLADQGLTGPVLLRALAPLVEDGARRAMMAEKAGQLARPQALADILTVLAEIIKS